MMEVNIQNYKIKILNVFLVFFVIICEILSSEVPRPRGVPLSKAALYNPNEIFRCLDQNDYMEFSRVNDDYCDCMDGTDEPGTTACQNGVFHCTNAGHKPQNIPTSRVNDGVCDCCDGTDEYMSRVHCANNCLELGRAAREEALKLAELVKAGKQLKVELSQTGIQLKEEKKKKLQELARNREEAIQIRNEKEALKKESEEFESIAIEQYRQLEEEKRKKKAEEEAAKLRAEAIEVFVKFDSNQDGRLDMTELQARVIFDRDRNGEVSEEEAKSFLNNEESVDQQQFLDFVYANIKPLMMVDTNVFKPPVTEEPHDEDASARTEVETEAEHEEEVGEDLEEEEEEEEDPDHRYEEPEQENVVESPQVLYDDDTMILVEQATLARNEFTDAEMVVRDIETEIKNIEEYLEKDFGPDEEFATLQGQCFEYSDHEYIYKLCPFDKTIQQPKSGSSETRLGVWGRWAGPEDNKYQVMMYERGQSCWNGPQRSTEVRVSCGSENKVTFVTEPNRCEYLFEFLTPAACRELPGDSSEEDHVHDEL